jgi:hypothetical protein
MYGLQPDGTRKAFTCNFGSTNYGCTAFCRDYSSDVCEYGRAALGYPYSTSTISALIESYYLLDVVSQEMNPWIYSEQVALDAQAIAARSFLGWYINNAPGGYDNSNNRQVFIPFKFDSLNPSAEPLEPAIVDPCSTGSLNDQQHLICGTIASRFYIARGYNNPNSYPAFAEFTSDVKTMTRNNPDLTSFPYLASVLDPISTACDSADVGANLDGMSQKGANRWARGHECSRVGAPPAQGNDPGEAWSIKWGKIEQILFHYYTGVHLYDETGEKLSPDYRWNPLQITGLPTSPNSGSTYGLSVQVQNVGVVDLTCSPGYADYSLRYRWSKEGHSDIEGANIISLCGLQKGSSQVNSLNLQIPNWGRGIYTLRFDVYAAQYGGSFWFSSYGWFPYYVIMCVDGPCQAFVPTVMK